MEDEEFSLEDCQMVVLTKLQTGLKLVSGDQSSELEVVGCEESHRQGG